MKFPRINVNTFSNQNETLVIENIDPDLLEDVTLELEVDPTNRKTFIQVINAVKFACRGSFEYKSLMEFLKEHREFNATAIFRGVKKTKDVNFSVEVHHTPFVMEDIIVTVINKRIAEGESLKILDIAKEVMYIHYDGLVGLVGLDKTSHAAIHSPNCPEFWFPIQFIPFGNSDEFVKQYMKFIPDSCLQTYAYIQDLSIKYDNLKDVIPKYMSVKKLRYDGFIRLNEFKELLETINPDN